MRGRRREREEEKRREERRLREMEEQEGAREGGRDMREDGVKEKGRRVGGVGGHSLPASRMIVQGTAYCT